MPAVSFTCVLNGIQYAPPGGEAHRGSAVRDRHRSHGLRTRRTTGEARRARCATGEARHSRCTTREARGSRRATGEAQVQGSRRTIEEARQNSGAIGDWGGQGQRRRLRKTISVLSDRIFWFGRRIVRDSGRAFLISPPPCSLATGKTQKAKLSHSRPARPKRSPWNGAAGDKLRQKLPWFFSRRHKSCEKVATESRKTCVMAARDAANGVEKWLFCIFQRARSHDASLARLRRDFFAAFVESRKEPRVFSFGICPPPPHSTGAVLGAPGGSARAWLSVFFFFPTSPEGTR